MTDKYHRKHTKDAIDDRGEVFTPLTLVDQMLDKLPQDQLCDPAKTVGDIAGCGNGNFLIRVLERRMANGIPHLKALSTIYGVDIDETNVKECRERLALNSTDSEIWTVLNRNIICADTLNSEHEGWDSVGYMWDPEDKEVRVERREEKIRLEKLEEAKRKANVRQKPKVEQSVPSFFEA
jgi:type I restriction-modification system DNA methylase subunit